MFKLIIGRFNFVFNFRIFWCFDSVVVSILECVSFVEVLLKLWFFLVKVVFNKVYLV